MKDGAGETGATDTVGATGATGDAVSVPLVDLAHARSGDKGDIVNIGLVAYEEDHYDLLVERVTAERVQAHFGDRVDGQVERFELPKLHALNFVLHQALDGGGTVSLMTDAQGKVFSTALLRMEIEVPRGVAQAVAGRGRVPVARRGAAGSIEEGTSTGEAAE